VLYNHQDSSGVLTEFGDTKVCDSEVIDCFRSTTIQTWCHLCNV